MTFSQNYDMNVQMLSIFTIDLQIFKYQIEIGKYMKVIARLESPT